MNRDTLERCRIAWSALLSCMPRAARVLDEIVTRYGEPHRRYHGLSHLDHLARLFAEISEDPGWTEPRSVAAALLYHDAVYDPLRSDNEARSADLAQSALAGTGLDLARIRALIEATAGHGTQEQLAPDPDRDHFLDADMAVLGAEPAVYDRYEAGVLAEYSPVVPIELFRAGRARFLRALLDSDAIFRSAWFTERFEQQARSNLRRALSALTTASSSTS